MRMPEFTAQATLDATKENFRRIHGVSVIDEVRHLITPAITDDDFIACYKNCRKNGSGNWWCKHIEC